MSFYQTKRWRFVRRMVLARDRWRCVSCNADVSRLGQARVDHIKPLKTHPDLACDMSNLRTLCPSCDNQGHREKGQRKGSPRNERFVIRGYDRDGNPIDPSHHWLTKDDGGRVENLKVERRISGRRFGHSNSQLFLKIG